MINRLGVLNNLYFAVSDSITAIAKDITSILTNIDTIDIINDITVRSVAIPHGKNIVPSIAMNSTSLICEDSSIIWEDWDE